MTASPLWSLWALALAMMTTAVAGADNAPKIKLKAGDRIVFLGDSITEAGAGPKGYVTLIRDALGEKHKDLAIEVIGAGISGNKVPDIQNRLDSDVLEKKPTLVVIYIGINDVWHGESDPAKGTLPEAFAAGLKDVISRSRSAGARVVLCTPTVIGEKKAGANKLDARLDEYSDISRKLAAELKIPLCDLRKAFAEHLAAYNPDDKEAGILTGDRVHLNDAGHQFVADTMLNTLDP